MCAMPQTAPRQKKAIRPYRTVFMRPAPLSMAACLQAAQAGDKAQRLLEILIAFVADEAEIGHARSLDVGQHFIDGQVAGVGFRLELEFRFDRQA